MPELGGPSEEDKRSVREFSHGLANDRVLAALEEQNGYLKSLQRDIQALKSDFQKVVNYMHDAESEVPEKMRRFIMYFHDVHDLQNLYHEQGLEVPKYILREVERCADRYRHLVEDLEKPGETFEKVRREMGNREGNRYDHTAMLPKQENKDETRSSTDGDVGTENGA